MDKWKHLQQEKTENRLNFLKIDPIEAQKRACEIIRPELWTTNKSKKLDWSNDLTKEYMKQTPQDIKDIFYALQDRDLDIVLVGGQAINFWASDYRDRLPELIRTTPTKISRNHGK